MEPPVADRDVRLHAAVDAYVPLHAACAGHERLAHEAGTPVITLGSGELADAVASTVEGPVRALAIS